MGDLSYRLAQHAPLPSRRVPTLVEANPKTTALRMKLTRPMPTGATVTLAGRQMRYWSDGSLRYDR